ncbi:MAG: hypothetical protein ACM3ZU_11155 [Bacteroidota bacterium]
MRPVSSHNSGAANVAALSSSSNTNTTGVCVFRIVLGIAESRIDFQVSDEAVDEFYGI